MGGRNGGRISTSEGPPTFHFHFAKRLGWATIGSKRGLLNKDAFGEGLNPIMGLEQKRPVGSMGTGKIRPKKWGHQTILRLGANSHFTVKTV